MRNDEILTITLDYDKNIYVTPHRSTANLARDLDASTKHIVDEELHDKLMEARNLQWMKKKPAPGWKIKRVKWYLLLDAFMKDYSDTGSFKQGARMTTLLKNAIIKDTDTANKTAIDSGIYDSSGASEDDLEKLVVTAGLDESSEDLDLLVQRSTATYKPERILRGKQPRPSAEIEASFQNDWQKNERAAASKAAAGKQPYHGRGKTIGWDDPRVHRYDNEVYSGYGSSDLEVSGTPTERGSSKRKIKSMPRHERLAKKTKKSEKEMSIHESREMQKSIEEHSMIELHLGRSSLQAGRITTVKIDDTDTEWVDVLVNTFKNRTSSMVAPICCIVDGLPNPRAFNPDKKHEYTYRTIGGNHSRTAFARLIATASDSTDPYMVNCWRFDFLSTKNFF